MTALCRFSKIKALRRRTTGATQNLNGSKLAKCAIQGRQPRKQDRVLGQAVLARQCNMRAMPCLLLENMTKSLMSIWEMEFTENCLATMGQTIWKRQINSAQEKASVELMWNKLCSF